MKVAFDALSVIVTSGWGIHPDPLGFGLSNQAITVLNLDLLDLVVLQGGQSVMVNIAIDEASCQSRPTSNLQVSIRGNKSKILLPYELLFSQIQR